MRWATVLSKPWALAAGLTILLIAVNILVQPQFAAPQYIGGNLDLFAPLALAAVASTPSILAGGIHVSIGPLLGLVNILVVSPVLPPALQGRLITPVVCARPLALRCQLSPGDSRRSLGPRSQAASSPRSRAREPW